jgi:hypothetical protein
MPVYAAITTKTKQTTGNDSEVNHVTDHNTAPRVTSRTLPERIGATSAPHPTLSPPEERRKVSNCLKSQALSPGVCQAV